MTVSGIRRWYATLLGASLRPFGPPEDLTRGLGAIGSLAPGACATQPESALASSLRPIVSGNRDLDYFDRISCINMCFAINNHFKNAREAREWLVRAYTSLPEGIEREPDSGRREPYARIKEIHDREIPGGGQGRTTSGDSSARHGNP
jgi:hypothetical protein